MEYFNPHSNEWLSTKFQTYKILRDRDAAFFSEKYGMYVITRHHDVISALRDDETFSSAKGNLIVESPHRFGTTLGASDNPVHDVLKNIAMNAYSKNNIARIVSLFEEKSKSLFQGTEINVSEVCEELSAWVTAEILNLPHDKEEIKDLVKHIQRHASQAVSKDIDQSGYDKLISIITSCLEARRPSTGPGIYHEFLTNNPRKVKTLSLFTGPTISGASSLTGALELLTIDAANQDISKDDISSAVLEALRINASTGRFSRTVTKDVELHGVQLKVGDRVALCLDSANRDERVFENPDQFILNRKPMNLAFGYGLHACIAMMISKAIMNSFLSTLIDFGKYRVVTEELEYLMTSSGNNDMILNLVISK